MPERIHKADEVFGMPRGRPLNYIERTGVDDVFYDSLARDKHIVIYGSSKQGKTALRKSWLGDNDFTHVGCLNSMSLAELHAAILKKSGYKVEQSSSRAVHGGQKFSIQLAGKGKIPWVAEASGTGKVEADRTTADTTVHAKLEIDLADVNDIIVALREASAPNFIVLEDFHYLPIDTQVSFSMALKLFHEESHFSFVVIGVWREKNRLIYFNGDLASRVVAVDADEWTHDQLHAVIMAGEPLLNVQFDDQFKSDVVRYAQKAVYLVQEACLKACYKAGVYVTGDELVKVGADVDANALIREIVDEQAGRYNSFIRNVSEGFKGTDLKMYRWLIHVILAFPVTTLARGLTRMEIAEALKRAHPEGADLNEGNITQALTSIANLQVRKEVRPIILDYDQTNRVLNVVDRAFLIWLSHQDVAALQAELPD